MTHVVCPKPNIWAEVHRRLQEAANMGQSIPPPPVPLILAGWAYTNDIEKRERWRATLAWAERYALGGLIGELPEDSMHVSESLSDNAVGPMGGPMRLAWSFDPKPRVSFEEAEKALETLRNAWLEIAGPEIGPVTAPWHLTGSKKRRLVVTIKTDVEPPWGTWVALARDERRRLFTRLRANVNCAIAPLEVDHVDFVRESSAAQT